MVGAPIQGTQGGPNTLTTENLPGLIGDQIQTGTEKAQLVITPKLIEQNERIIRLLKTMIFHMELITGQEGVEIG